MESGVDFIACDMPQANKFTIHIFAALAEQEADLISQRTKAALNELRQKGVVLGSPQNLSLEARKKGLSARQSNTLHDSNNKKAGAYIQSLRKERLSFAEITRLVNEMGFKTRRGGTFQQIQVRRLFDRYNHPNEEQKEKGISLDQEKE